MKPEGLRASHHGQLLAHFASQEIPVSRENGIGASDDCACYDGRIVPISQYAGCRGRGVGRRQHNRFERNEAEQSFENAFVRWKLPREDKPRNSTTQQPVNSTTRQPNNRAAG